MSDYVRPVNPPVDEPEPSENDLRSDREDAYMDRTVRWHSPDGYRGVDREYL